MGNFKRPMMHKVICSDCGKECEVPFRPTGDRPVFCNDCFRKHKNESRGSNYAFSDKRNDADQYKEQFGILNAKLDKILNVLNPVVPVKTVSKKKTKTKKQ